MSLDSYLDQIKSPERHVAEIEYMEYVRKNIPKIHGVLDEWHVSTDGVDIYIFNTYRDTDESYIGLISVSFSSRMKTFDLIVIDPNGIAQEYAKYKYLSDLFQVWIQAIQKPYGGIFNYKNKF